MTDGALRGLRVVEFCDELGSYCGRLLGDLGAEVIKVEPPGGGRQRQTPPFVANREDADWSLAFWVHNTSKRSVVLDLEDRDDRERAHELALSADVVIEDYPVGYLASRGLGADDLLSAKTSLVYTSITGFGQTGPHAAYAYSDIVGQAMGGVMTLAGDPADPPNQIYGNQANISASIHAAIGVLAAVRVAEATGAGQHVDVSAQESLSMSQETAMQTWDFQRKNRVRTGGLGERGIPIPGLKLYESADGHIFSMATGGAGAGFEALVAWMRETGQHEDLDEEPYISLREGIGLRKLAPYIADPASAPPELVAQLQHMSDVLAKFFKGMPGETAYIEGQRRRLLIGLVSSPKDLAENEQLRARKWFVTLDGPGGRKVEFPGAPYRLSATPVRIGQPPRLGEHRDEVMGSLKRAPIVSSNGKHRLVRPLEGVRVADFSWFGAGPIAGLFLAALGAEVVRVESEAKLDGLRSAAPGALEPDGTPKTGYNISGYFNNFNAGKLSLQLNLNTERGQELAHRLIERSDVFLTNFTPRVIDKWRLGYDQVAKTNPRIIAAYAPMQGMDGPHRDFLGFGGVLTPVTGFSYMSGYPQRPPIGVGTNYPDYAINPGHTTVAILAALRHRDLGGNGQYIELPQVESVVATLGTAVAEYLANGTVAGRGGNRNPIASPHGAFRCADDPESVGSPDRWLAIACRTDTDWAVLASVFGEPELAGDPRFATLAARKANEDALEAIVSRWVAPLRAEEAMERLQARGIAAGVVQNAQDLLERDVHMRDRKYYQYLPHPETGLSAYDNVAARLSHTPASHRAPAPLLGEHTLEVCTEILGLDLDETANLLADGILV